MAIESLRALMEAGENQDLCDIIIHSDCVPEQVVKADCKCPLYL